MTCAGVTVRSLNVFKDVCAVTSLDDDVFVVCINNNQCVEVYNAASLKFQTNLLVPGLGYCSWGLAACGNYRCVYASDWSNDRVHRVDLSDGNPVMTWSVASNPAGLSVNSEHNLLVVSQGKRSMQEFTTYGILLREYQLWPDDTPWQVVQVNTSQLTSKHSDLDLQHDGGQNGGKHYVGTRFGPSHAVSLFSMGYRAPDETESHTYSGVNRPAGVAVDKSGRVLVADWYNDRLQVLVLKMYVDEEEKTPRPTYLRDRSAHTLWELVEGGLKGPCGLWYDQARKRLCVGECERGGNRVIIIDNLEDFTRLKVD